MTRPVGRPRKFTQVPNPVLDALTQCQWTASEFKVMCFLIRNTWGWNTDSLNTDHEQRRGKWGERKIATKTRLDRRTVQRTLKRLETRNVILRVIAPRGIEPTIWKMEPDADYWDLERAAARPPLKRTKRAAARPPVEDDNQPENDTENPIDTLSMGIGAAAGPPLAGGSQTAPNGRQSDRPILKDTLRKKSPPGGETHAEHSDECTVSALIQSIQEDLELESIPESDCQLVQEISDSYRDRKNPEQLHHAFRNSLGFHHEAAPEDQVRLWAEDIGRWLP